MNEPARQRIFLYSHDTYGLGHLRRSLLIAGRLAARAGAPSVLIATGSARTQSFSFPQGCDALKLPSVTKWPSGRYRPRTLNMELEDVVRLRSQLLLSAVESFRPDLILVDHTPAGLEGELRPLLRALAGRPRRPLLVLGLRDIIDDAARVADDWHRNQIWPLLDHAYDRILVYGGAPVLTTAEELGLRERYPGKVRFVGYLGRRRAAGGAVASGSGLPQVLVTAGGGGDGQRIFRAYTEFLERTDGAPPCRSVVVTGPFLSRRRQREIWSRLAATGHPVEVIAFCEGLEGLLRRTTAAVSMAGYNTAVELLAARVPALLVPREEPRLEQRLRAERLAAVADFEVCRPGALDASHIEAFLGRRLAASRPGPLRVPLAGLDRVAAEIDELLGAGAPAARREVAGHAP